MSGPVTWSFGRVDDTSSPGAHAAYLDGLGASPWAERCRAVAWDLLGAGPGARVVDVGCGTGTALAEVAARVAPGGEAVGVDRSLAMLDAARARLHGVAGVRLVHGEASATGLPGRWADGCRAERVLQHLDDPSAAVAEMARLVRPGGRVVMVEPDWGTLVADPHWEGLAAMCAAGIRSPAAGRGLARMAREAGLEDIRVVPLPAVMRRLAEAEAALCLPDAADAEGSADAAAWLAAAGRADRTGDLLICVTSFAVAGRVPVAGAA